MMFVNYEDCNGCGACIEACACDAILLQNDKATIDQECCEGCQACIDACLQEAIQYAEVQPQPEPIRLVTEPAPLRVSQDQVLRTGSIRSMVLPVLGSMLMWTGRELLPRLTNLALKALDQRILSTDQGTPGRRQTNLSMQDRYPPSPRGGKRRRLRQRRNRWEQ